MKKINRLLIIIGLLSTSISSLSAQEKELCITYKHYSMIRMETLIEPNLVREMEVLAYKSKVISRIVCSYDNASIVGSNNLPKYKFISSVDYNKTYLLASVYDNEVLLKEPLPLFQWSLSNENTKGIPAVKKILGYHCNKAECTFRGRDYVAWFTNEIPFKAAPWKFHGLPGVMLEVYSKDTFFKWEAKSLEIREHTEDYEPQLNGAKILNLEEHIDNLTKQQRESIEHLKKQVLAGVPMFTSGDIPIEIFTPELDPKNYLKEYSSPAYQEMLNNMK